VITLHFPDDSSHSSRFIPATYSGANLPTWEWITGVTPKHSRIGIPAMLILDLVLATQDLIWIDRINVAINPERQDAIMGLPC